MPKPKIKAWLRGESALAVVKWVFLNSSSIIETVQEEAPDIAEQFKENLWPLTINVSSISQSDAEERLTSTFGSLPTALGSKLEMRFRSYKSRKEKLYANLTSAGVKEPPANINTWVTKAQATLVLDYLYDKMDTVKVRPYLLKDANEVYNFQNAIYAIKMNRPDTNAELQKQLNEVLQQYVELKGWRELKHTVRSYKHIIENKLVSIKVDSSAKKKLDAYKQKHKLNNMSEVVHALCGDFNNSTTGKK